MPDGVYCNSVVKDRFQERVFGQFVGELYRYWAAPHDVAHLTWVGMSAPPGKQVANDDEVGSRRTGRTLANGHRRESIGGVGLEALWLAAGLLDSSLEPLCRELDAVDERHSRLGRKSACKAHHPEAVAPVADIPGAQLLAVELGYVGVCLAVLAGLVS
jgi:hypothetical protein